MEYRIVNKTEKDNEQMTKIIGDWGSDILISRGKIYTANNLEGLIAYEDKEIAGVCLYYNPKNECEIVLLETMKHNNGIGTTLINNVKEIAKKANCNRLWLTTSNDNINALRFYQRRGFYIANVHVKGMDELRKVKPEIPLIGDNDIPVRDEFEMWV